MPFKTERSAAVAPATGTRIVLANGPILDRAYAEAMGLLYDARAYARDRHAQEVRRRTPPEALKIGFEAMRVTARLTQVMAWLLLQKAVAAGELTPAAASAPEFSIEGGSAVTEAGIEDPGILPAQVLDLLDRSFLLYQRVRRLERMFRAA